MRSPYRLLYSFFIVFAFWGIMGCSSSPPKAAPDVALTDYPTDKPESEKFQLAQALRNKGAFDQADSLYQKLLLDKALTPAEKEFAQLNQLLCRFAAHDTLSVNTVPLSKQYAALSGLVNAIASSRKERNSFEALYKARELLKEEGLTNSFYYFTLLEQLGLAHKQRGSYLDSIDYYYQAAYHFTKQSDALALHRIRLLHRRALHSLVHRDELTGIGYIEEALSLHPSETWCTKLFIAKATLYRKINRPDEAALSLQEAHQRIQQLKLPELKYLYFYEECFQGMQAKDSLKIFSALDSLKTLSSIIPEAVHYIFHLKGHYYYERDKVDDYLYCFEKSLAAFKRNRWSSISHIYQALYALTEGYTKKGNFNKAETYAFQSLAYATHLRTSPYVFENIFDPDIQAETYNFINYDLLGSIYLERFERDKKKSYLQNAFRIYTLIDSLMLHQIRTREDESTYEFLRIGHGIYANGIETCYQLFRQTADSKYVNQAHLFMERSKSLITYQDILKHDDQYFPSIPKTFKEEELKLKMNLSFIKSKKNKASPEELSDALTALADYYDQMKTNYPEYYQARQQPDFAKATDFSLEANAESKSIINYHLAENRLYGIRYDGKPFIKAFTITHQFSDSIQQLRKMLTTSPAAEHQKYKQLAYSLYQKIVKPFEPLRTSVEVVPDGILSAIPFEALVSDTTGDYKSMPYLLKQHTIAYRFGLKSKSKRSVPAISKIAAYAFFSKTGNNKLPNLPGVLQEINDLQSIFTKAETNIRSYADASRENFLSDIEDEYDLLHIGMHATSDLSDYLLNKIYFLSEGNQLDTVYGFEIIPKRVKADMVVLSSCESGYGKFMPGEGTISLARSFQQTGVATVISSLWSLPDYSSPIVCKSMYQNIEAGSTPASGLTSAKRNYLANADQLTAHPFFWAGLVCY